VNIFSQEKKKGKRTCEGTWKMMVMGEKMRRNVYEVVVIKTEKREGEGLAKRVMIVALERFERIAVSKHQRNRLKIA
jgi:hypothetical protein